MKLKELDNKKNEKMITTEELNLPVGTRLQLITLGLQKGQYYSSLIGFEPNQYIFIKMPQENGFNVKLSVAEHVEVRVFTGISILKFTSSVEYIYQTPRNFVELAFPKNIQLIQLREDFRIDLKIQARVWQIKNQKLNKTKPAELLDLSITGTMLQSASYLGEIGDKIGIAFVIQNTVTKEDMIVNTMTVIRNSKEEKNASGHSIYRYGLLFQELRPFYQATLQNFINDQILRDRKVIF